MDTNGASIGGAPDLSLYKVLGVQRAATSVEVSWLTLCEVFLQRTETPIGTLEFKRPPTCTPARRRSGGHTGAC